MYKDKVTGFQKLKKEKPAIYYNHPFIKLSSLQQYHEAKENKQSAIHNAARIHTKVPGVSTQNHLFEWFSILDTEKCVQ